MAETQPVRALRAGGRGGRRYRSGIRPLEDRVSLSASPWSEVDAAEVAAILAGKQFVADELVVAVKTAGGSTTFEDLLAMEGAKDAATVAAIRGATLLGSALSDAATQIYQVTLQAGVDLTGVIAAVSKWSNVEWAAPNFVYAQPGPDFVANDPNLSSQWHLAKMQAAAAWDITQGAGVVVAVMDNGVDWDHPDLAANIWNNSDEIAGNGVDDDANGFVDDVRGWDFSSGDNDPGELNGDAHGTHVAGIIAARTNNGVGVAGVAGQAKIMPVRFFGSGAWTSTVIFNSYKYAVDNGAKIINTSYDIDGFVGDAVFDAALDYAYSRGVLLFNSAGNGSIINPPRGLEWDQIIFVASTDQNDNGARLTNRGPTIDISAPGEGIYSTMPGGAYGTLSGTSMASANAAGVASLIWAANPTFTREQVLFRMFAGAVEPGVFVQPGSIDWFGAGRIDAYRALTMTQPPPSFHLTGSGFETNSLESIGVYFHAVFDEASMENLANWELRGDGADNQFDTADDVIVSLTRATDYMVGTNFMTFNIVGSLANDFYRFKASGSGIRDPFNRPLDGNGDGVGGDDYTKYFEIDATVGPTISAIGAQDVLEDAQANVNFTVTDPDTPFSSLTFTVTSGNTNLVRNAADALQIEHLGGGAYRLIVQPEANRSGSSVITISVSDGNRTATRNFNFAVTSVNDAPSFTRGADVTVVADGLSKTFAGWATALSTGPNEVGQTLTFQVTNDAAGLFNAPPTISSNGTLGFTTKLGATGTATVTVVARDNGGTSFGGVDASAPQTFVITLTAPASISAVGDQSTLEDVVAGVTFSYDGSSTPAASLVVSASSANTTLFPNANLVITHLGGKNYRLDAAAAADRTGAAQITLSVNDGGFIVTRSFQLTVTPVNDAPSFTVGDDRATTSTSPVSVAGWARNISQGPNETGQTLHFVVSSDNPWLFAVLPTIAADGTLTYTAAAGVTGRATVSVRLEDDGGTAGGGVNSSVTQTFEILVDTWQGPVQAGKLDTSFGSGGTQLFAFGPQQGLTVERMAVQSDGKLILAGFDGDNKGVIARFDLAGNLDTTFGSGGRITMNTGAHVRTVALQSDGKIVAAVSGVGKPTQIYRLNADGTFDSSFVANGANFSSNFEFIYELAIGIDGRIAATGLTANRIAVLQLTSAGAVDFYTTFADGATGPATALAYQKDGKLIVGWSPDSNGTSGLRFTRLTNLGALDASFGTGGTTVLTFGGGSRAALDRLFVQDDGRIVAVGTAGGTSTPQVMAARFTSSGALDPTFGQNGLAFAATNAFTTNGTAAALLPNGKIVGIVSTSAAKFFAFNSDGTADTAFDTSPQVSSSGINRFGVPDIALQTDGRIVVSVIDNRETGWHQPVLFRVFGEGPVIETNLPNLTTTANASDVSIDLRSYFLSGGGYDPSLTFAIVSNSNPGLFDAATIAAATDTLVLDTKSTASGTAKLRIRATNSAGQYVDSQFEVTVSPAPPATVLGVYARGTAWSGAFTSHLQTQGMTDAAGWLELSRGAGQTDTLPWSNVNQLLVKFANLPALAAGSLRVVAASGVSLPNYIVAFDSGSQTALVSFDQALPMGKFQIWIDDAIGNFDGEWTDNVSTTSGNGTAGGDFAFRFNVLPGDFDRSQSVAFGEIGQQRNMIGRTTASGDYNYRQDYDGSGSISFGDYGQARNNLGTGIGTMAEPTPPPPQGDSVSFGPESDGPELNASETSSLADAGPPSGGTELSDPSEPSSSLVAADATGVILGWIWGDLNRDGLRTGGEVGVADTAVELFAATNGIIGDVDDVSVGVAVTDAMGNYQFTGLATEAGYYVVIRTPAGATITDADVGGDDTVDSDVNRQAATSGLITLASGEMATVDAGLIGGATAGGWQLQIGDADGIGQSDFRLSAGVTDAAGNVYVTGSSLTDRTAFGSGTNRVVVDPAVSGNAYVAKYTAAGELAWVRSFDVARLDGLAVDAAGDVVMTGYFYGTTDFDPGAGSFTLTSKFPGFTSGEAFVVKLDSDGVFSWVRAFGTRAANSFGAVAIDAAGSIHVAGEFRTTADFDPGSGTTNLSTTTFQIFVATFDSAGNLQRALQTTAVGSSTARLESLAIHSSGLALGGYFTGTIDFDPGTGAAQRTSISGTDAFVLRLDSSGLFVRVDAYGTSVAIGSNTDEVVRDLTFDQAGNLYVVGLFTGIVDFDPGPSPGTLFGSAGQDVFVAKYAADGSLTWVRGGTGDPSSFSMRIAVDHAGRVIVGGNLQKGAALDFDPGPSNVNRTGPGAYLWRLDAAGNYLDVYLDGGADDFIADLATDPTGRIIAFGRFNGTLDFDSGAGTLRLVNGNRPVGTYRDVFVVKFDTTGDALWGTTIGGGTSVEVAKTVADGAGNIYAVGFATGAVDYDSGVAVKKHAGIGMFLSKYTNTGSLIWTRFVGDAYYSPVNMIGPVEMDLDASGNVYLYGGFRDVADIDPGSAVVAGRENSVLKFDSQGTLVWSRSFLNQDNNTLWNVAMDVGADGSVVVGGWFQGTFDFDPGAGVLNLTPVGISDAVYVKLNSTGDLAWARQVGTNNNTIPADAVRDVAIDASGKVAVVGSIGAGNFDFDPGPGSAVRAGDIDYVLQLDAFGNFIAVASQTSGSEFLESAAFDSAGNLLVTGRRSRGGEVFDVVVLKYSPSGTLRWRNTIPLVTGVGEVSVFPEGNGGFQLFGSFTGSVTFDNNGTPVTLTTPTGGRRSFSVRYDADFHYLSSKLWTQNLSTIAPNGTLVAGGTYSSDSAAGLGFAGYVGMWNLGVTTPEIDVRSADVSIASGDSTPTAVDGTSFGGVAATSTVRRVFTIVNSGLDILQLAGTPRVSISGANAGDFVVTQPVHSYVEPGQSLSFEIVFTPSAAGLRTAVVTIATDDSDEASYGFTIEGFGTSSPPRVLGVYAGATAWSTVFQDYLLAQGLTDVAGWFELSRGAGQSDTLPWANVNQLRIQFADLPALKKNDVRIIGSNDGPGTPSILDFEFDVDTQVAVITFDGNLPSNKYLIYIDGSVSNFDGEWTDNVSTASGNGTAGGDFAFRFNVLPGDFDRSQSVAFGEIGQQRNMIGRTTAAGDYNYRQDYDGSGSISFGDYGQARLNLGLAIGTMAEPTPPPTGDSISPGPESYVPDLYSPESYVSQSYLVPDSGPESYGSAELELATAPADAPATTALFVETTFDASSLSSSTPDASATAPIIVPSTAVTLSHQDLARAWSATASLPVATVLGRAQIAAPVTVRALPTGERFASVASSNVLAELSSAVDGRAVIDTSLPQAASVRWRRLHRQGEIGRVSDEAFAARSSLEVD